MPECRRRLRHHSRAAFAGRLNVLCSNHFALVGGVKLACHGGRATFFPIRAGVQSALKENLVPLRDHFHPAVENIASWEEVHGAWPATIAYKLNATLPPQYRCGLKVHLGTLVEVDVATFERDTQTVARD